MATWFASDVHLDAEHPAITRAFIRFLDERVAGAERLFVLGDLFESWVGDDDPDPDKAATVSALRRLADAGTECFFMHGNRDFLIGPDFASAAHMTLLPEEWVGNFYGERVLLMHGDSLCTDDHEYMAWRRTVRNPDWQSNVLRLELEQRLAMAAEARARSARDMAGKDEKIMDVNQAAVLAALQRHNVKRMIHGHTHRPATHEFVHEERTLVRHVLGDWYDQGRVLRWDTDGLQEVVLTPAQDAHCEN